jgi:hypothetical protein
MVCVDRLAILAPSHARIGGRPFIYIGPKTVNVAGAASNPLQGAILYPCRLICLPLRLVVLGAGPRTTLCNSRHSTMPLRGSSGLHRGLQRYRRVNYVLVN